MNSLNGSIHHQYAQTKDENASERRLFVSTEDIGHGTPAGPSGSVGSDLTASDYARLESRWIDHASADRAGLSRVDSLTGGEIIGRKFGNYAGILTRTITPAPITSASTDCVAISPISNPTPLAI